MRNETMPIGSLPHRFRHHGALRPLKCDTRSFPCRFRLVLKLQNPTWQNVLVRSGHLVGRIVVAPKPSLVDTFASPERAFMVVRLRLAGVVLPHPISLLPCIARFLILAARMSGIHLGRVSLEPVELLREVPNVSEVVVLCLLGLPGGGIEALPPGVHLGNMSLVLETAVAERVLPLQTQSDVLRCGLGGPSLLEILPVITLHPDLVYTES